MQKICEVVLKNSGSFCTIGVSAAVSGLIVLTVLIALMH